MSTTYHEVNSRQTPVATPRVAGFFARCLNIYHERRLRRKLRAALLDLSDRELMDIGTTRGEVDYVAAHRACDPRGAVLSR
jgi:uncharacterized protein YjiS (DUF1127 family)